MGVKIRYHDGDPNKGIVYDWQHIRKEYKKLKCPADVYYPLRVDFDKAAYDVALSDRSQGKTTNPILATMIMHRDYGTAPHYLRQHSDMCTPKMLRDLFSTIQQHDYIKRVWGEQYNDLEYHAKRWWLLQRSPDGDIITRHNLPVLTCFGLDESDALKSTYNSPTGDAVIMDEFISSVYGYSDFIHFQDILKTIFRDRLSPIVWMLSNTINLNSPWFDELTIRDQINTMKQGESQYIETALGTNIFVEILSPKISEQRQKVNRRLFGFPNPKLAAITGQGTWATEHYQHIPPDDEKDPVETLIGNLYIRQSGKYVRLRLVYRESIGYCVYVTPATRIYDDSVILTAGDISDPREIYGFGPKDSRLLDTVWRLYRANRWYYATNSEGALVRSYISLVKSMQRDRFMI